MEVERRFLQPLIGSHCDAIHWQQSEESGYIVVHAYTVLGEGGRQEQEQYFQVFRTEQELIEHLADEFDVQQIRPPEERNKED